MSRYLASLAFMASLLIPDEGRSAPDEPVTERLPPILACEQAEHRIILLDAKADWREKSAILWQWCASKDARVAREHRAWFTNPSDAKCLAAEHGVLVVASGGGVALVDFRKTEVVGYGYAGGNPHSAAMLPDGRIVTVSSTGSLVQLFERQSGKTPEYQVVQKRVLSDAHGVVWDDARGCIWALGGQQIKRFDYDSEKRALALSKTIDLPVNKEITQESRHGGHDLVWSTDGKLLLSETDFLWTFDPETHAFAPLPPHQLRGVKSLSRLPGSQRIMMMQATTGWWSDTVRSLDGKWVKTLPGAKFYKARWWGGVEVEIPPSRGKGSQK